MELVMSCFLHGCAVAFSCYAMMEWDWFPGVLRSHMDFEH